MNKLKIRQSDLPTPIGIAWWTHQDTAAWLLLPCIMVVFFGCIPDISSWLTLTIAGLATGMMLFIMTVGFNLVFGLMGVLNFGHSVFISLGAYCGFVIVNQNIPALMYDNIYLNLLLVASAVVFAMIIVSVVAVIFERLLIRRVYKNELMQILVTIGGLIVIEQVIYMIWGSESVMIPKPLALRGSWSSGDFVFEKYRMLALVTGLLLFASLLLIFKKTKIGLLIRAGVENREMVESFGYNVSLLFTAVFVAGAALAALGGVLWSIHEEEVSAQLGQSMMVAVFIIAICGGLGSIMGCFVTALLVGLLSNYVGYIAQDFVHYSTITLMIVILIWRPRGLIPLNK